MASMRKRELWLCCRCKNNNNNSIRSFAVSADAIASIKYKIAGQQAANDGGDKIESLFLYYNIDPTRHIKTVSADAIASIKYKIAGHAANHGRDKIETLFYSWSLIPIRQDTLKSFLPMLYHRLNLH